MEASRSHQPLAYLQQASDIIRNHPQLQRHQLKLVSCQGRLSLHGQVCSYFEKQIAQEALRQFDHQADIENDIQVAWSS